MYSNEKTIEDFISWLRSKFPRFYFEVKKPLRKLFPEPKKFRRFWKNNWSHADIGVFSGRKLVCVIEPGGYQHLIDKEQMNRDKKKKSICEEFNVYFLPLMNQTLKNQGHKEFTRLLRNAFYSKKGIECLL